MTATQIHRKKLALFTSGLVLILLVSSYGLLKSSNNNVVSGPFGSYRDCSPKRKVAFLKTHKCASTSIQNILMRYGLNNDLNFVLPLRGNYLGKTTRFHRAMLFDTPWEDAGMEYHIFTVHTKWDSVQVGEVLGDRGDVAYISMLRDPVELFRSMWDYLPQKAGGAKSLEEFAMALAANNLKTSAHPSMLGVNQMLRDFGMTDNEIKSEDLVRDKIAEIEEDFDLIMIAERFEDSIVLMRHKLCWDFRDVVNFKLNSKDSSKKSPLSEVARETLKQWLWADYLLYNHFKDKFKARVEEYGQERLEQDKRILRSATEHIRNSCVETQISGNTVKDSSIKPYGKDIVVHKLKEDADKSCQFYVMKEMNFIDHLRDIQKDKSNQLIWERESEVLD